MKTIHKFQSNKNGKTEIKTSLNYPIKTIKLKDVYYYRPVIQIDSQNLRMEILPKLS